MDAPVAATAPDPAVPIVPGSHRIECKGGCVPNILSLFEMVRACLSLCVTLPTLHTPLSHSFRFHAPPYFQAALRNKARLAAKEREKDEKEREAKESDVKERGAGAKGEGGEEGKEEAKASGGSTG